MNIRVVIDQAGVEEAAKAAGDIIDDIALEIAASADPPVDTGFLRNSVYIESARVSTFDQTWPSDYYQSTKQGRLVIRERADGPEPPPDEQGATIGWAAVYAWYVEDWAAFIYSALMGFSGAEDRGPLNIGGGRFVSPKGPGDRTARDSYIDPSNSRFVSPEGPSGSGPGDDYIDPGNRNFVSPTGSSGSGNSGSNYIDRSNRNFVSPDGPASSSGDDIDRSGPNFVPP